MAPYRKVPRDDGGEWIYATRVRHWRTGRYIYPKRSRFFRFRRRRK